MSELLKSHRIWVGILSVGLAACAPRPSSPLADNSGAEIGIIGGEPVPDSSALHQKVLYLALGAQIEKNQQGAVSAKWNGHCTASAIAPRIILTAAHCVEGRKARELQIVLTPRPSEMPFQSKEWYAVQSLKVHENYTGSQGFLNDLALLRLQRDLPSTSILKIGTEEDITLPMELLAIGFGTSSESSNQSDQSSHSSELNEVQKFVTSIDPSQKTFSINQNDHRGFCSGDSGGPGLIKSSEDGKYVIAGVVSNVSMESEQKNMMDPEGKFSLCIGQGNYTNVLNPELRRWIEHNKAALAEEL